ncbi:hypothetical protein [Nostoc sp. ChiQUE01b]|uniref:hypothetical protein n=1 Tax=Nostoc sp. ChiQUE01b TaxID=3075376 RepID=UPI002AD5A4DC|nr:hypothetical protein [Nostoc sp. ChiQUE01b]MDZ8264260.1 hypothetical protein [Nostoc sp. ChiQUE01b]
MANDQTDNYQQKSLVADAVEVVSTDHPPSEADFAAAAKKLVPPSPRRIGRSVSEPLVPENPQVEVVVAWDFWKEQSKKTDRYLKSQLRLWQGG